MHTHPNLIPEGTPPDRWVSVVASDALVEGNAIEKVVEGRLIAIFRNQAELYAIDGLCAHHGGPLSEGEVKDGCVTCPWHGWQYRLNDGTQTTSGAKLIESYPVRDFDGSIEIGFYDQS
jgi:nitrite reductase (NADH) small subunit